MIKKLLTSFAALVLCAALPGLANAQKALPDFLSVQIGSKHVNMNAPSALGPDGYNEFNPGLFLTWQDRLGGLNYTIGSFRNSFDEQSTLLAVSDLYPLNKGFYWGWFLGVADYSDVAQNLRFSNADSDWVPVAGLQMNYRNLYMQVLPANDSADGYGLIFTLGASFALKKEAKAHLGKF